MKPTTRTELMKHDEAMNAKAFYQIEEKYPNLIKYALFGLAVSKIINTEFLTSLIHKKKEK